MQFAKIRACTGVIGKSLIFLHSAWKAKENLECLLLLLLLWGLLLKLVILFLTSTHSAFDNLMKHPDILGVQKMILSDFLGELWKNHC